MNKENNYDPVKDGAVVAIRIYGAESPKAVLVFAFGGSVEIEWTVITEKQKYEKGISGYTYIFDERPDAIGRDFESFIKE